MNNLRRILLILPLSVLFIFIQATLLRAVLPDILVPNLVVISLVFLSFYVPNALGSFLCFLIGLSLDLYSGVLLGPWAGAFVVTFLIFSLFSQRIFVESSLTSSLMVMGACLMANFVFAILMAQFRPISSVGILTVTCEALFSGLVAKPIFKLLKRVCFRRDRGSSFRRSISMSGLLLAGL